MRCRRVVPILLVVITGDLALGPRPSQAQVPGYKVQSIAKHGDSIGDLKIAANGWFAVSSLNDGGQLAFTTLNAAGGEMLFQYRDGIFTPIVAGGRDAPGGKWPRSVSIWGGAPMNQHGDMIFMAGASGSNLTTYRWNHQTRQVSIVAAAGMPAVDGLTYVTGGDGTVPAINDYGEVVFQAKVKDSAGKSQRAIFFLGRDDKLTPVLLPGQTVAGAGTIAPSPDGRGGWFTLNNSGAVGFHADRQGDTRGGGAFVWEQATITPVLLSGAHAPGDGKFVLVGYTHVNNTNRNVWVGGNLDGTNSHWGFYMLTGGQLVPMGVPGQEMPGGGKYAGYVTHSIGGTGPNALIATLEGGDTGVYRFDDDGNLSLIVKGSTLGANLALGDNGIAINAKGEVAFPVRFTGDRAATLIFLTPTAP